MTNNEPSYKENLRDLLEVPLELGNIYNLTIQSTFNYTHATNVSINHYSRDIGIYMYADGFQTNQNGSGSGFAWTTLNPNSMTFVLLEQGCSSDVVGYTGINLDTISKTKTTKIDTTITFNLTLHTQSSTTTTYPMNFPILPISIFSIITLIDLKYNRRNVEISNIWTYD